MTFKFGGESYTVDDDDFAYLHYWNDILNGLYIDLDDNYAFITEHDEGNIDALVKVQEMGGHNFQQDEEIDFTQPPHCYVVASVGRMIVATAESFCKEACD